MAVSFVWAAGSAPLSQSSGLTNMSLTWSSGAVQPGDVLMAFCKGRSNPNSTFHWVPPAGWDALPLERWEAFFGAAYEVTQAQVFYRVADSTETSPATFQRVAEETGSTFRDASITLNGLRGWTTRPRFAVEVDRMPSSRLTTPDSTVRGMAVLLVTHGNVGGGARVTLNGFTQMSPTNFGINTPAGHVSGLEASGLVEWPHINATGHNGSIFYKVSVSGRRPRRGPGLMR